MPLDRLVKLSLAIEDATKDRDWNAVHAMLDERQRELNRSPIGSEAEAAQLAKIDERVIRFMQGAADASRHRRRELAHSLRAIRAYATAKRRPAVGERLDSRG
jgi:hypothetical protein